MKKALIFALLFAMAGALFAGTPKKSDLSFAQNWDEATAEAAIRNVPILFVWPERS